MSKAALAILVVVLASGCGGGGKKAPQLTRAQYVTALNKLCVSANNQIAALQLTTSVTTWKQNGAKAAKIAKQTVAGFEALTPPDSLRDAAERQNAASEEIVSAVQDAADAAKSGDVQKFDEALSRQQNAIVKRRAAQKEIGATACVP